MPPPTYPLGTPGSPFVHAGPRMSPRILMCTTAMRTVTFDIAPGADLFAELDHLRERHAVHAASVELVAGSFSTLVYVHPALGPDAQHPMSFTEELRASAPAVLRRGSGTIGFRQGNPFSHLHASFTSSDGEVTGGHLLPGTLIGEAGLHGHLHTLDRVRWVSRDDPETGFPVFAPEALTETVPAEKGPGEAVPAVIARVRPGVLLDAAVTEIAHGVGFDHARLVVGLGSTVGARLDPSGNSGAAIIEAPWPAVEFTRLEGSVTPGGADLRGEVVDVDGTVVAGTVRAGENPVAVTFELLLAAART